MSIIHAWFDLNSLKLKENITNIEFDLRRNELYQEDQIPHDFNPKNMINENGDHLIKIEIDKSFDSMIEISSIDFADEGMENLCGLLDKEGIELRRSMRSKEPIGRESEKVCLLRAMDSKTDTYKPMDYVLCQKQGITKEDIDQVKAFFEEEEPIKSKNAHKLKWVAEHAQNNAVVYGKEFSIGLIIANASDVYKASNEGEFLYDGKIKKSTTILKFNELGEVMSPALVVESENEMKY